MCAMEMVAWLAGEPHSDEPACACPVLSAFVRAVNDSLSDDARNRLLRPLVPQLVNTRGSAADERQRGYVLLDGLVRELVPAWLRRHRRPQEAALLSSLPPVRDDESLLTAHRAVQHYAKDLHAAVWVLQRAVERIAPARFVAGAVQVARALNDVGTWSAVRDLVVRMVHAPRPTSDSQARLQD